MIGARNRKCVLFEPSCWKPLPWRHRQRRVHQIRTKPSHKIIAPCACNWLPCKEQCPVSSQTRMVQSATAQTIQVAIIAYPTVMKPQKKTNFYMHHLCPERFTQGPKPEHHTVSVLGGAENQIPHNAVKMQQSRLLSTRARCQSCSRLQPTATGYMLWELWTTSRTEAIMADFPSGDISKTHVLLILRSLS